MSEAQALTAAADAKALSKRSSLERAAILMLVLGEKDAASVLKRLDAHGVHKLGKAMTQLGDIKRADVEAVLDSFLSEVGDESSVPLDSETYLKRLLIDAIGEDKAMEVLERIFGETPPPPPPGVPGVEPAKVTVLGGGTVGSNAAKLAAGLGANVVVMDINLDRLRYLDDVMPPNVRTIYSDPHSIRWHVTTSDLVIGAVLIPGARAPVLVERAMLSEMRSGAVIVDVGIDQGGCIETSRPTTHAEPTFVVDDVVHYCVANMPGAVGRTSTQALCHATQPFVLRLAELLDDGGIGAARSDPRFASSLNARGRPSPRSRIEARPDLRLTPPRPR